MIRLEKVDKYYNKGQANAIHVLNQITLELPDTGMVAVFGRSGCGKTTLLNAIGGLDGFSGGSLTVNGQDIRKDTDTLRNREIGYIFQNYNLIPKESVQENVADALRLVAIRASEMQKCCEAVPGGMAAIIGLPDAAVEEACAAVDGIVIAANYNCDGQVVISGEKEAVAEACARLKEAGAKRALPLSVGGAFHSPLMEPARLELGKAIEATPFIEPVCPVYQNVTAAASTDPATIKANLLAQLTSPVRWTQSVKAMIEDGADAFVELGPGTVLQGLVKRISGAVGAEVAIEGKQ